MTKTRLCASWLTRWERFRLVTVTSGAGEGEHRWVGRGHLHVCDHFHDWKIVGWMGVRYYCVKLAQSTMYSLHITGRKFVSSSRVSGSRHWTLGCGEGGKRATDTDRPTACLQECAGTDNWGSTDGWMDVSEYEREVVKDKRLTWRSCWALADTFKCTHDPSICRHIHITLR